MVSRSELKNNKVIHTILQIVVSILGAYSIFMIFESSFSLTTLSIMVSITVFLGLLYVLQFKVYRKVELKGNVLVLFLILLAVFGVNVYDFYIEQSLEDWQRNAGKCCGEQYLESLLFIVSSMFLLISYLSAFVSRKAFSFIVLLAAAFYGFLLLHAMGIVPGL